MFKKLIKSFVKKKIYKYSYSSSDLKKKHYKGHPYHNKYGHHHYKKKYKSGSFSSFFSS